jgi:hypothetical protein
LQCRVGRDARTPAPDEAVIGWKCVPAPWDITLRFTAWHRDGPGVVVASAGCPGLDVITVNGGRQPLLWDMNGGLAAIALALLQAKGGVHGRSRARDPGRGRRGSFRPSAAEAGRWAAGRTSTRRGRPAAITAGRHAHVCHLIGSARPRGCR